MSLAAALAVHHGERRRDVWLRHLKPPGAGHDLAVVPAGDHLNVKPRRLLATGPVFTWLSGCVSLLLLRDLVEYVLQPLAIGGHITHVLHNHVRQSLRIPGIVRVQGP